VRYDPYYLCHPEECLCFLTLFLARAGESQFIRTDAAHESTRIPRFERARRQVQLAKIFDGVNYIQDTPWLINRKVLAVVEAVQAELISEDARSKLKRAKVDPLIKYQRKRLSEKEDPDRLVSSSICFAFFFPCVHADENRTHLSILLLSRSNIVMLSRSPSPKPCVSLSFFPTLGRSIQTHDACLVSSSVQFAKQDRAFYFPHSIDYRGRLYSDTPYIHPAGDDLIRGLITFKDGKPLGEEGLRWLKIHASGVQGQDKSKLEQREAWSTKHIEEIRAIARDPVNVSLHISPFSLIQSPFKLSCAWTYSSTAVSSSLFFQNRNWVTWKPHSDEYGQTVDKPWEFLAACFELADAYELSDPTKFVSSLPCHQDGTCNGLQYYAALGRDLKGGKSVNLCDNESPQDVYSEVLGVVRDTLQTDPDEVDLKEFFEDYPKLLQRKSVKTTVRSRTPSSSTLSFYRDRLTMSSSPYQVMTSVYGSSPSPTAHSQPLPS
jgi:hypothetical protein